MTIEKNKSLRSFNTFGIDVLAKYFVDAVDEVTIQQIINYKKKEFVTKLILGGGSNILFTKNFNGLVVHNLLKGISVMNEDEHHVYVKAAAGEVWHNFVRWNVERNYAGLENLSLIPGYVGAAPMQNIGAYGAEINDTFYQLEAINLFTGEKVVLSKSDCEFGYRESVFKHRYKNQFIITSVTFCLNKQPRFNVAYGDIQNTLNEMNVCELTLKAVSDAVIKIRASKLPHVGELGNAGSFFKNPTITAQQFHQLKEQHPLMPHYPQKSGEEKIPAGWLIEQCGWKGKQIGNVGAHKSQALVLVNYGGATGNGIIEHAHRIQQSVKDKFGIEIETEVNVI